MQFFLLKQFLQTPICHALFFIFLTMPLTNLSYASFEKYKNQKKLAQLLSQKSSLDMESNNTLPFVGSIEAQTVKFIHDMVNKLRYSSYKLGGTRFDTKHGIYILDCSTYVDQILKIIYPLSYFRLVDWSRSERPTTYDYYRFFKNLNAVGDRYWHFIENVSQLRPGDILVFRKKNKRDVSGHVMIIMDKPVKEKNILKVRIADSAPFRHSKDTRARNVSGIGIGTFLLKFNPKTYKPLAYAWQSNSPWKHNVKFAMARPYLPT